VSCGTDSTSSNAVPSTVSSATAWSGARARNVCAEESLPLLGGGVPLRDRGSLRQEDGRLVGAAGVVGFFPDVDVAEFAGDVFHGAFGRTECDDVGEVAEER